MYELCVCVTSVFFWFRKDWRNWLSWKATIDTRHPHLLGKWLYPKKSTSSSGTHFGREGHKSSRKSGVVSLFLDDGRQAIFNVLKRSERPVFTQTNPKRASKNDDNTPTSAQCSWSVKKAEYRRRHLSHWHVISWPLSVTSRWDTVCQGFFPQ